MLKNMWYAVAFTHEITDKPTRLMVLGQQLVAFRQKRSGKVVVMSDLPESERPPLPDWGEAGHFDNPRFRAVTGEFLWNANYERVTENGVDVAHTPWVHGGAFGNRDKPEVEDYTPVITPWSAEATVTLNPPARNVRGLWKWIYRSEPQDIVTSTAWFMPSLIRLHVRLPLGEMVIYDTNIPVDETTTLTKFIAFRSFFTGKWADKDALKRTYRIFEQDKDVVEGQRPELLPMDLAGELHMRSDAMSMAYRRRRLELLEQGWGIASHRIKGGVGGEATVIPSPARRENPELARAWVLKEVASSMPTQPGTPDQEESRA
jgi:phenylpropionate dioxygenase-like ring-hydroxylating dioxygenase large terminal subunit